MITPSYSLTANERVLPKLALDFTTATLDSRITLTRSLDTATRVNSSGFVEVVNADLPRFDFDPVSLVCKGLLIEESRQNLILYSQDFSQATWSKNNTNLGTNGTSPSNTSDAALLIPNNVNTSHSTLQNAVSVSGSNGIHTLFAKAGGYSKIGLRESATSGAYAAFNLTGSGSVITSSGVIANSVDIKPYKDGWFRLIMGVNAASQRFTIYPMADGYTSGNPDNYSFAGDLTSGVYVWGAGIEAGLFATSYIPTTTTSVTRNADVVSMTGTNFSDWFNASEGTFMAQWLQRQVDTGSAYFVYSAVGDIRAPQQTFGIRFYGNNGSNVALSSASAGNVYKTVIGYKDGFGERVAINGGTVSVNGTAYNVANAPTLLGIGGQKSGQLFALNGHVQKLLFWPQRLIDAEISAFSK